MVFPEPGIPSNTEMSEPPKMLITALFCSSFNSGLAFGTLIFNPVLVSSFLAPDSAIVLTFSFSSSVVVNVSMSVAVIFIEWFCLLLSPFTCSSKRSSNFSLLVEAYKVRPFISSSATISIASDFRIL